MNRVLDPVMGELREMLLRMGSHSEAILDKAMRSVVERDSELAAQVATDDLEIDRLDVSIDAGVLKALALQAPVAADLRAVIAIKMIATDLERVGDLARNIAKSVPRLAAPPASPLPPAMSRLASSSQEMLSLSLNAFSRNDADLAREVLAADDALDAMEDDVVRSALQHIAAYPGETSAGVDLVLIAKNLERVGDHATNVAEDVILLVEARNVKHADKL